MAYATKQSFGGQRVSCARMVVIKVAASTRAGVVVEIDDERDEPLIRDLGFGSSFSVGAYRFVNAKTEAEVDAMPPGSWCWPPRV